MIPPHEFHMWLQQTIPDNISLEFIVMPKPEDFHKKLYITFGSIDQDGGRHIIQDDSRLFLQDPQARVNFYRTLI